jgi:adenylate cyclase
MGSLPEAQGSAEIMARKAIALDGADAEAHLSLAFTLLTHGDFEGALVESKRALAISPNLASAHVQMGQTLIHSGRPKEGIAALEASIRLDPRDPWVAIRSLQLSTGFFLLRQYEAAVEIAKQLIRLFPDYPLTPPLARCCARQGRSHRGGKRGTEQGYRNCAGLVRHVCPQSRALA